jgi:hypothetical protein
MGHIEHRYPHRLPPGFLPVVQAADLSSRDNTTIENSCQDYLILH